MNNKNNKKLVLYLSFKQSEKELYEKIKSLNNYSQLIKQMMNDYFLNEEKINVRNDTNTITLTIDDLCRVISSVNISSNVVTHNTAELPSRNEDLQSNSSIIPEDMLIGL